MAAGSDLPSAARRLRFELRLAARYLVTGRREGPVRAVSIACAAGVLVGVAALVLALALMAGVQADVRGRLLATNPHVVVGPGWGASAWTLERAEEVGRILEAHGQVVAWAPHAHEWGWLRSRLAPAGVAVQVKGVDPDREDAVTGLAGRTTAAAWQRLRAGAPPAAARDDDAEPLDDAAFLPPEPPAILLGVGLALELGVVPGDIVHLAVATPELTALGPVARSRALTVGGLVDTGLHEYDQRWAVVGLGALARVGAGPRIDGVQAAVVDPMDSAAVARALAAQLGDDVHVTDWTTTFSRLFAAFKWERLIMILALGLIGLVAGFNILTILTMNVMARVADIGVLAALGATPGAVTRVFAWMGLGLGGGGTAAGLGLGAAGALLLDRYRLLALDPAVYLIAHVPFRVQALDLVAVAAGMLGIAALATLGPVRWVARMDPVEALRSA